MSTTFSRPFALTYFRKLTTLWIKLYFIDHLATYLMIFCIQDIRYTLTSFIQSLYYNMLRISNIELALKKANVHITSRKKGGYLIRIY